MEKRLLYVTKWALARGILALQGTKRPRRSSVREWYFIDIPDGENRMGQVGLGTEAFLTLEEAQSDALRRWEDFAAQSTEKAKRASEGLLRVRNGDLQVHMSPNSRVSKVAAFTTSPFKSKEASEPLKSSPGRSVDRKPRCSSSSMSSDAERIQKLERALAAAIIERDDANLERSAAQKQFARALHYISDPNVRSYCAYGTDTDPPPLPALKQENLASAFALLEQKVHYMRDEGAHLRSMLAAALGNKSEVVEDLMVFTSKWLHFEEEKGNPQDALISFHLPNWQGMSERAKVFNANKVRVTVSALKP